MLLAFLTVFISTVCLQYLAHCFPLQKYNLHRVYLKGFVFTARGPNWASKEAIVTREVLSEVQLLTFLPSGWTLEWFWNTCLDMGNSFNGYILFKYLFSHILVHHPFSGNRSAHYRGFKPGVTLVHRLACAPRTLARFRERVEEELPNMYDWFPESSLHITIRAILWCQSDHHRHWSVNASYNYLKPMRSVCLRLQSNLPTFCDLIFEFVLQRIVMLISHYLQERLLDYNCHTMIGSADFTIWSGFLQSNQTSQSEFSMCNAEKELY